MLEQFKKGTLSIDDVNVGEIYKSSENADYCCANIFPQELVETMNVIALALTCAFKWRLFAGFEDKKEISKKALENYEIALKEVEHFIAFITNAGDRYRKTKEKEGINTILN